MLKGKIGYNQEDNTYAILCPKNGYVVFATYGVNDVSVWYTGSFKEYDINDGCCDRGTIREILDNIKETEVPYNLELIKYLYSAYYTDMGIDRNTLKDFCESQFYQNTQYEESPEEFPIDTMLEFECTETGQSIVNPFMDTTGRFEVEPIDEYGEEFLNSDFIRIMKGKTKPVEKSVEEPPYYLMSHNGNTQIYDHIELAEKYMLAKIGEYPNLSIKLVKHETYTEGNIVSIHIYQYNTLHQEIFVVMKGGN